MRGLSPRTFVLSIDDIGNQERDRLGPCEERAILRQILLHVPSQRVIRGRLGSRKPKHLHAPDEQSPEPLPTAQGRLSQLHP
jgi:hypothetical protein